MKLRTWLFSIVLITLSLTIYLPSGNFPSSHTQAQSGQSRKLERQKRERQGGEEVLEGQKGDTIKVETNLINLDITVVDKKSGGIYQNLKPGNFEIYEDGVKQEITNFGPIDVPLTVVMILEYSRRIAVIRNEVLNPASQFVSNFVKPKDQVAIVAYDQRPAVLNDFTDNSGQLNSSVNILYRSVPAFNESNLFDALTFVIDGGKLDKTEYGGIREYPGHTAILLVSSGLDTFSKTTYDKTLKLVESAGIPIYSIGIGNLFFKLYENRLSDEARLTFYQAGNQLRSFSELSGGHYFPVTFEGEIPSTLKAISAYLRNQYSIGYATTNSRREGKRRKIEVHVDVDGDGKADDKKVTLQYRKTYVEPKG